MGQTSGDVQRYWIIVGMMLLWFGAHPTHSFRGPSFLKEPPNKVVFHNSSGAIIPCIVTGVPTPTVHWTKSDWTRAPNIPGLRHTRQDGSIMFSPFRAEDYRQDIHGAVYRCVATNSYGSIGSTDVHVRGVVLQDYEANVYDEFVISGNTAVFRCQVPDFMKEFLSVTSWTRDDGLVIVHHKNAGAKYIVLKDGELHIRNAAGPDNYRKFRCHVKNTLTGNVTPSVTAGQLMVSDATGSIPPRITSGRPGVVIREGENAELPCTAQGYPVPQYTWYRKESNRMIPIMISDRTLLVNGSLFIERARAQDSGKYVCSVNNSIGEERVETELTVYGNMSVSLHPPTLTTESGRSATLNCSVQGYPVHSISWFKDTRHLVTSSRVRLIANQVLHITSVLREDQGMYQCFVYGSLQSMQSASQIILSEDAPILKHVFARQTIQPGERFSLRCVAAGNPLPRVTWQLDARPVPETHRVQYGDFVSVHTEVVSFVNVSSARSEDGGVYECRAQNDAGAAVHRERVDVLGMPYIRGMGNVTVVDGDSLYYHCPASGYPVPSVTWSKDGRELPFNERQQVNTNGSFFIKDVTRETDEGTYVCSAVNKQKEKVQKELHIRVMKKPQINPFSFPKLLAEGNHVIVTCSVLTGDPPITVRWLKDGMTLNKKMLNIDESSMGHLGSALAFNSVGKSHNGNYTCMAENAAGESNFTATMLVNVPPRWRVEPVDSSSVVGDSVVFDCQAEGYPQPLIRWKKTSASGEGRSFKSIISNYHIQTLENGSLSIKDVSEEDRGHYLCEAANGVGADLSTVVKLAVHVAAHFKVPFRIHRVTKGDSLNIQCEAFGEKPITIEWSKDKVVINSNTETRYNIKDELTSKGKISSLFVTAPDRRDSALFTCTAINAFGKDDTNFQVLVEEVPDPPGEILATDVSSRGVTLSWNVPYTGNSPVTKYVLYWKGAATGGSWSSDAKKIEIPGSNTSVSLFNLIPMTTYDFKIQAENMIGRGQFGETISITTEEEVPSEPPSQVEAIALSTHSIRVMWKPPPEEGTHGKIRGYYVGHKILNSPDHYTFKTIEHGDFDSILECTITNLHRATEYSITVQAFNNRGAGPPSKDTYVKTHENDPPPSPMLRIVSSTSSAVVLEWDMSYMESNSVKGYQLFYKAELNEWDMKDMNDPLQKQFTLRSLSCGTKYQFYIVAFNDVGRSDPSDVVSLTTQGGSPIAPEKTSLLSVNTTFVTLNLNAWKTGGCPISFFKVRYKARGHRDWIVVSDDLDPLHEEFTVTGLNAATWYNLLMSAQNDAGITEAEYVFPTLTLTGGTITPIVAEREGPTFYRNLSVLVPIICAIVVLLVITLVILIICLKKNRNPDYATPNQNQEHRNEQKGDTISMASVGKKVYETPRETLYYPSPYATTRISMYSADSESSSGQTNSLQRPGLNHHRAEHTYDVPFPQKFRVPSSYSVAAHDYQQLFTDPGLHEFVESFDLDQRHLIVQRMCLQARDAKSGHHRSPSLYHPHHPLLLHHHHHHQSHPHSTDATCLPQQHIYRLNRHSDPDARFAHDYLSDGNSEDEEGSSSGEKTCFQGGGNTTDSHEMSEAECDRDYLQHLRKGSQSPFVKYRIGPNCGLCADAE